MTALAKETTVMRRSIMAATLGAICLLAVEVPVSPTAASDSGTWISAASMETARSSHTATLLPGGSVLAAGGSSGFSAPELPSAELYNAATDTWSGAASMATARSNHTATLLLNGKVLVVGGYAYPSTLASAELYDPATNIWSSAGNLATARSSHTATLLSSGKVLVTGGANGGALASAELYDPGTNTWSAATTMTTARLGHTATRLASGEVLVAGGDGDGFLNFLAGAELYDPGTNTWSSAPSMSTARARPSATLLLNGKVLVAGGEAPTSGGSYVYSQSAELYDPIAHEWSAAASMTTGRSGHTATRLLGGEVLVTGSDPYYRSSATELYDSTTDTWFDGGSMSVGRLGHTATLLEDGRVLVAGDWNNGSPRSSAELYKPAPPVVVLVHGYDNNSGSTSCGMEPLAIYIETPANMGGKTFKTECLWYRTRDGVIAGAVALKQRIDAIGAAKIDIVAHSMGGLVARYYIEKLGGAGKVRSLTMLGTPNWGTVIAIPPCDANWWWLLTGQMDKYDYAACDLVPLSNVIRELNLTPGSHDGVAYKVIIGWASASPVLAVPNDCVVSHASAVGLAFPVHLPPPFASHVGPGVASLIGCIATGEVEDQSVKGLVAQILLQSTAPSAAAGAAVNAVATEAPPADAPAASTIAWQSGVIAPSATAELPVMMPSLQADGTFIFRAPDDPSASLTFELLRPGGTPVASTDGDVTYESGAGFGGLVETHYTIANPAEGTWTMRVTGTTVPESGWPYDMQALVPGGISVTAGAGAGHYDTGTVIDLSADVAVNATPYAGTTVNATITKPDSSTALVALTDAGGGSYTGSFGDTSACGLYQITVTAEGSDNGTPFSRQDRTLAFVGVPGNMIMDPCVADTDGDGLTDADEINAYGTNPASDDTDADVCGDAEELALVPPIDPADPWDFYSVPVPALFAAANPLTVFPNNIVSATDAQAVFAYFTQGARNGDPEYEQDLNANGIKDGLEYDRSVIAGAPGVSGPPNGIISATDAQLAFAQFTLGYKC